MTEDPYYTDLVQHISLPLELMGLFLAGLELYFTTHARAVEDAIDRAADHYYPTKEINLLRANLSRGRLVGLMILYVFLAWMAYVLWNWFSDHGLGEFKMFILTAQMILLAVLSAVYILAAMAEQGFMTTMRAAASIVRGGLLSFVPWTMGSIIAGFNRIGKGHAIGGIGLTLGGIGILGEVYQVIMMDKDGDTKTVVEWVAVYATVIVALGVVAFFINRIVKRDMISKP